MVEFEPNASIPREDLLQLLRHRVADTAPDGGRLIAEGILGAESRIDFVTIEPSGLLTVLVVSDPGEELAAIGRAVAHRAWVEARLPDWLQLSPQLGASSQAGVRATVLGPFFSEDARVAATALGESTLRLVRYHVVRDGSEFGILLEKSAPPAATAAGSGQPAGDELEPVFRTGITDADLGISGDGLNEFE